MKHPNRAIVGHLIVASSWFITFFHLYLYYLTITTLNLNLIIYMILIQLLSIYTPRCEKFIDFINWLHLEDRFNSMNVIEEEPIKESGAMFLQHPHGIFCYGGAINFVRKDCSYYGCPILISRLSVSSTFGGIIFRMWGMDGVNAKNLKRYLQKRKNVMLVPGGFDEAAYMSNQEVTLFLRNRKGFVKYGLQYGYHLYPGFTFNENRTWYIWEPFRKIGKVLAHYKIPGVIFFSKQLILPDEIIREVTWIQQQLLGKEFSCLQQRIPLKKRLINTIKCTLKKQSASGTSIMKNSVRRVRNLRLYEYKINNQQQQMEVIDQQIPQVLYVIGGPGSGKGTQCERLVRDFKYHHISVGDIMREEIQQQTKDGLKIKAIVEKGQIVPSEMTVQLLIKKIKNLKGQRYLIDGFPRTLEQALLLEQKFREIDYILDFDVPENILKERLMARSLTSGRKDDNEETIKQRIQVFNEQTKPVREVYKKLGKVYSINGVGEIEDIYNEVRQGIIANVTFFYGGPSLGKSSVGQRISDQCCYRYLNLKKFYRDNNCKNSNDKLNKLMKFLTNSADRNFIIDDFLENRQQLQVFEKYYGRPYRVVYFNASKDEIEQNMREHNGEYKELQQFLNNKQDLLKYLKEQQYFKCVNAVDSIENIMSNIIEQPQVYMAITYNNDQLADQYIEKLVSEEGFTHLDMDELLEQESQRGIFHSLNAFTQSGSQVPVQLIIQYIRKILYYNPKQRKFIITKFPLLIQEIQQFEKQITEIKQLITFNQKDQQFYYYHKMNSILYFKQFSKLLPLSSLNLEEFKQATSKKTQFGYIFGPQFSGKSTFCKFLANQFQFKLIEWESTINQLKEKLGAPGEPLEEVPLNKIVDYYKQFLRVQMDDTFIFDGLPPLCENEDQIKEFLSIGQPQFILFLNVNKECLWKRYKIRNELDINQELTADDEEKLEQIIQQSQPLQNIVNDLTIQSNGIRLYQVDSNHSQDFVEHALNYIFQKRVFIVNVLSQQQQDKIKLIYLNVATQYDMTFVDVQLLIKQAKDKQEQYDMRWTQQNIIHPSNYLPQYVINLIKQYLSSLPQQKQDIILWGYPSADIIGQKKVEETLFPRPSDEIIYIEKYLGPIRIANIFTEQELETQINDKEWVLEKPPEKPQKIVDPEEAYLIEEEQPPQEEEEEENAKPKFNIYEYQWTKSENPKNVGQIYNKMKLPTKENIKEWKNQQVFKQFEKNLKEVNENIEANFYVEYKIQQ